MIASEYGRFQFKCVDELPHFQEAFMLVHFDELAIVPLLETGLAMREIQYKRSQEFRLRPVCQQCRIQGVLLAESGSSHSVDDHDGTFDSGVGKTV